MARTRKDGTPRAKKRSLEQILCDKIVAKYAGKVTAAKINEAKEYLHTLLKNLDDAKDFSVLKSFSKEEIQEYLNSSAE